MPAATVSVGLVSLEEKVLGCWVLDVLDRVGQNGHCSHLPYAEKKGDTTHDTMRREAG
jgi:hypothetical protein